MDKKEAQDLTKAVNSLVIALKEHNKYLDKLAQRYVVVDKPDAVGNTDKQEHYNKPITEDDLKKLTAKFNVKKK